LVPGRGDFWVGGCLEEGGILPNFKRQNRRRYKFGMNRVYQSAMREGKRYHQRGIRGHEERELDKIPSRLTEKAKRVGESFMVGVLPSF